MEQLTKNQAVATSQEAVQNQNEPQLRDENAHNDKSVQDRKSGSAGMPRPISYAVFCLKKKINICRYLEFRLLAKSRRLNASKLILSLILLLAHLLLLIQLHLSNTYSILNNSYKLTSIVS